MTSGGPRNRAGRKPDPTSARSDRRGFTLTALPASGFDGDAPEWPLLPHNVPELHERELAIWAEAWRTPQACAWSMESWRWPIIAEYCRIKAGVEDSANAALIAQLHRYRDQIGLTPAGLRENGWAIAAGGAKLAEAPLEAKAEKSMREKATASGQFKVIAGGKRAG